MNEERKTHWPKGVVIGMLLAMVTLLYAVSFLIRNPVELVREDYYDAEISHQEKMNALAASAGLEKKPQVAFAGRKLNLAAPPEWGGAASNCVVRIYRPDDASQDSNVPVAGSFTGISIDFENRPSGRWEILLQWEMDGTAYMSEHELHLN